MIEEKWTLNILDYYIEHNLWEKNPKNLYFIIRGDQKVKSKRFFDFPF